MWSSAEIREKAIGEASKDVLKKLATVKAWKLQALELIEDDKFRKLCENLNRKMKIHACNYAMTELHLQNFNESIQALLKQMLAQQIQSLHTLDF